MHRLSGCSGQPSSLVARFRGGKGRGGRIGFGVAASVLLLVEVLLLLDYRGCHAYPQHLGGLTPPGGITGYYLL